MENAPVSKFTTSFGLAFALCALLNSLLVVAKEKNHAVANWMRSLTGHHWITHVLLVLVLFNVVGFGLARTNQNRGPQISASTLTKIVLTGLALSCAIIFAFYLVAD